jgi:hypothetical protein
MTLKLSYILPFFLIVNTLGASCVQFDSIKTYRVKPSKKVEGTLQRLEKFPSNFVTARNVDVWLPENFDNTKKYSTPTKRGMVKNGGLMNTYRCY